MPTFTRSALLRALDVATPALGQGSANGNSLSHVLVTGDGTTATMHATDYDVSASARLPYEGAPFILCAHGKSLSDVLRATPAESVELSALENHWIQIKTATSEFRIGGISPEDYPEPVAVAQAPGFEVPCRVIADLIGNVEHAQSSDETRPSLNGTNWEVSPEEGEVRIVMVATDGHRLSKSVFLGGVADINLKACKMIVARKSMGTIAKALDGSSADSAKVQVVGVNLCITVGDVTIRARLLDETFPDYTKVIPKGDGATRITLRRSELVTCLKSAATMTTAKTQIVKLSVSPAGLTISARNPELGESSVRVACDVDGVKEIELGANWKYLTDAMNATDGDRVVIRATDMFSPIVVTPADDDGTLHVVMPMRI